MNFKDVDSELGMRVFLIGPNASGKSNFLRLFLFLRRLAVDGLGPAVNMLGGVSAIRCLAATRYSNIDIDVTISDDNGPKSWRYYLVFNQDKGSRPVVRSERVENLKTNKVVLERPDTADVDDPLRLTQTALEQVTANKEFRPIFDFFSSFSYQHIIPQVLRDPAGFSHGPVTDDPFGRDFLLRLWNTPARTRDSRLRKIGAALKVAVPMLQELRVDMDSQGIPHLMGRYQHWRQQGAFQNEAQFSDGTLRLFGLLWTLFEGSGPLLLEEPELSLHAEVVRHLPQIFERIQASRKGRRQVVISTHSEEMLRDQGIGAEEVLRLKPTDNGTEICGPTASERDMLASGLTVAEVMLPSSAPAGAEQLSLWKAD